MSNKRARKKTGEPTVASKARLRYVRGSAQKARLVVDQIRGSRVEDAAALLKASPKKAARDVFKLLMSAVHNREKHRLWTRTDPLRDPNASGPPSGRFPRDVRG